MHRELPAYPGPLDRAADADISAKRHPRPSKRTTALRRAFERSPRGHGEVFLNPFYRRGVFLPWRFRFGERSGYAGRGPDRPYI